MAGVEMTLVVNSLTLLSTGLVAALVTACADGGPRAADDADTASSPELDARTPDTDSSAALEPEASTPMRTILVRLVPVELFSQDAVVGAEVCLLGLPNVCRETTVEGALFEAPAETNLTFVIAADGFLRARFPVPARDDDTIFVPTMFTTQLADIAADLVGVTRDPSRAMILMAASTTGKAGAPFVADAVFSVTSDGHEGPFYATDAGLLSGDMPATGQLGAAYAFNVAGDTAEIAIAHPRRTCRVSGPGWPAGPTVPHLVALELEPDTVSHVVFACPER